MLEGATGLWPGWRLPSCGALLAELLINPERCDEARAAFMPSLPPSLAVAPLLRPEGVQAYKHRGWDVPFGGTR